ncbi:uncharacterized protein LOC112591504 [Melanaphis sacchari]|uniref:uncharacterized protein LOC112591504 n=1 Tax=Melanaphis sacchari TaxID=742174 RepID=UPI000DC13D2D|nr:uncharacterized protein LOC112591504 [Melanaphis sacchari]
MEDFLQSKSDATSLSVDVLDKSKQTDSFFTILTQKSRKLTPLEKLMNISEYKKIYKDMSVSAFNSFEELSTYGVIVDVLDNGFLKINRKRLRRLNYVLVLRVCKLDDPTTLFGCKELNVRCEHFEEDRIFIRDDNSEYPVPANAEKNEGYALAISFSVEDCHPHHGQRVLVSSDDKSYEYLMICRCIREGYIGNDHLLGNCTVVRICNGKVKDINVPFGEIECDCRKTERSLMQNGIPMCRTLTISEANDLYNDWMFLIEIPKDAVLLNTKYYNTDVRSNVKVSHLLSPCSHSLINPSQKLVGS